MKKLLFSLILFAAPAWSQSPNPSIVPVTSAPSGACSQVLPDQQTIVEGIIYTCQSGTWTAIGSGSGGSLPTATAAGQTLISSGAGTTYTAGNSFANTLAFTTGQPNQYWVTNGNNVNMPTEFQNFQNAYNTGTYFFSDENDIGLDVPSGSSIYQSEALGIYQTCESTTTDCLPLYTQARRGAAGAPIWGANFNAWDDGFGGANMFAIEVDGVVGSTTTTGELIRFYTKLISGATYNGIHFVPASNTGEPLTNGLLFDNDSATTAINIGEAVGGGSMPITLNNGTNTGKLYEDSNGYFNFNRALLITNSNSSSSIYAVTGENTTAGASLPVASFLAPNLTNGGLAYNCIIGVDIGTDDCIYENFHFTSANSTSNYLGVSFGGVSTPSYSIFTNSSMEVGETSPTKPAANGFAIGTTGQASFDGAGNETVNSLTVSGSTGGSFLDINNTDSTASQSLGNFLESGLTTNGITYICLGHDTGTNNCVNDLFGYAGTGSASNYREWLFSSAAEPNFRAYGNISTEFGETTPAAGPANGIAVGTTGQCTISGTGAIACPSVAINGGTALTAQTGTGGTLVTSASPALTGTPTVPTASPGTNTTQAASTAFVVANAAAPISTPNGTPTYTPGTNVTSCVQASGYTNTNTRGEVTVTEGTATTGTVCTVNFSTTLAAAPGMCIVTQNGGSILYSFGHGIPTTAGLPITAGITLVGATTIAVDYQCTP